VPKQALDFKIKLCNLQLIENMRGQFYSSTHRNRIYLPTTSTKFEKLMQ